MATIDLTEKLSPNFTRGELVFSQVAVRNGISNLPRSEKIWESLRRIAENVAEPIRKTLGVPVFVSSGYRSPRVNEIVGGSPTSQHTKGEALDLVAPSVAFAVLFEAARALPDFDQIIDEFGRWVHVSYRSPEENRFEILVARRIAGRTEYGRVRR